MIAENKTTEFKREYTEDINNDRMDEKPVVRVTVQRVFMFAKEHPQFQQQMPLS